MRASHKERKRRALSERARESSHPRSGSTVGGDGGKEVERRNRGHVGIQVTYLRPV